jgi:hypothetical protein
MSTIGKDMSPGRQRALETSGSNIEADHQYMAPDGHPAGPGAAEDMAAKAVPPISGDATAPKVMRRSPFSKK